MALGKPNARQLGEFPVWGIKGGAGKLLKKGVNQIKTSPSFQCCNRFL
jgi:hypothetical protein